MANYCEVEFYETEKLVRATISPVGFFEWLKKRASSNGSTYVLSTTL